MPIFYAVDSERRVIFEKWNQAVSAADVREYWFNCLEDPRFTAIRRILVDIREAQIEFSAEELGELITEVAVPYIGAKRWAIASVVDSRKQYEMSRQYQIFIKAYSSGGIYSDRNVALAWLLKQDIWSDGPGSPEGGARN